LSDEIGRNVVYPQALPREFVHDLRNHLGTAVGTADLMLHDAGRARQPGDLEKLRDACLKAVELLERWDRRGRDALTILVCLTIAA
jgi:hypothetical protein